MHEGYPTAPCGRERLPVLDLKMARAPRRRYPQSRAAILRWCTPPNSAACARPHDVQKPEDLRAVQKRRSVRACGSLLPLKSRLQVVLPDQPLSGRELFLQMPMRRTRAENCGDRANSWGFPPLRLALLSWGVNVLEEFNAAIAPPGQEGWLRVQKNAAPATKAAQTGWLFQKQSLEQPPRRFAPPLLSRRGDAARMRDFSSTLMP